MDHHPMLSDSTLCVPATAHHPLTKPPALSFTGRVAVSWMQWNLYFRISQRWTSYGCGCSIRLKASHIYLLWIAFSHVSADHFILPEWCEHEFWQKKVHRLTNFLQGLVRDKEKREKERSELRDLVRREAMAGEWLCLLTLYYLLVAKLQKSSISMFAWVKLLGWLRQIRLPNSVGRWERICMCWVNWRGWIWRCTEKWSCHEYLNRWETIAVNMAILQM